MARDTQGEKSPASEDAAPAAPDLGDLAHEIGSLPQEDLAILAEMLYRADHEEHAQLVEEVELRQRIMGHMGRGRAGFLVLVGVAILVATVMRIGFFGARPFLGFGILGGLLLLLGLRGWYRAGEVRERVALIDARAEMEDIKAGLEQFGDRLKDRKRKW